MSAIFLSTPVIKEWSLIPLPMNMGWPRGLTSNGKKVEQATLVNFQV